MNHFLNPLLREGGREQYERTLKSISSTELLAPMYFSVHLTKAYQTYSTYTQIPAVKSTIFTVEVLL